MSAEPEVETGSENENKPEVKKRKEIPMQINPLLKLHERDYRAFNTRWDTRMQGKASNFVCQLSEICLFELFSRKWLFSVNRQFRSDQIVD